MFVSQGDLGGLMLEPHVDQLVEVYNSTSTVKSDDAIMSPQQGSEEPPAVPIIIDDTYYTLSSESTHSYVVITHNYICSRL